MARRGGMADFLTNFNAGLTLGKNVAQGIETNRVMRGKAETGDSYTPEDAQQLEAIGNAKDADGNNYYQINANQDGSYGIGMRGEDGKYSPVEGVQFKPQKYTEFLGKRYGGILTPEQIQAKRNEALVDIQTKYDPVGGMKMRSDLLTQQRQQKAWDKEDALEKLNADFGAQWQAKLVDEQGEPRQPTAKEFAQHQQRRAFILSQAGYANEANAAYKDALAANFMQIRLQDAERTDAIGPAIAAANLGNFDLVKNFVNDFVPGGNVTDVYQNNDKQIVFMGKDENGKPKQLGVANTMDQLVGMLASAKDPMALYNMAGIELDRTIKTVEAKIKNQDRIDQRVAIGGLAKERGLTPAETAGVQTGVLKMPGGLGGADDGQKFKADPNKVKTYFTTTQPGLIAGEPEKKIVDEEGMKDYYRFKSANKITDDDEGLTKFGQYKEQERAKDAKRIEVMRQQAGDAKYIAAKAKELNISEEQVRKNLNAGLQQKMKEAER